MGKRIIKHVRTPAGKFVKFIFIAFNLVMALWMISYWGQVSPMISQGDQYSQAGATIGSFLGTGMLVAVWALGAVILGIPMLLTRGDMVEYGPEDIEAEKREQKAKDARLRPYIYCGAALVVILYFIGATQ